MGVGLWELVLAGTDPGAPFTDTSHTGQLVYDPLFDLVLLYGDGPRTYSWDGATWTELTGAAAPNVGQPMVWFDENNATPMMFGGIPSAPTFNNTYSWDWGSSVWNLQSPSVKPSARAHAGIAFDSGHGNAIMFGGINGSTALAETYRWNGANWSLRSPANSPSARYFTSMAYDPIRDEIILFGGRDATSTVLDDTWAWSGAGTPNWTQKTPATVPPERENHGMCWDPFLEKIIMYGGSESVDAYTNSTWAWDGTDWEDISATVNDPGSPPLETYLLGLCYYTSRDELTLVTGRYPPSNFAKGDTWVLHHTLDRRRPQLIRWR